MAGVIGNDPRRGPFAAVECDAPRCYEVVLLVPRESQFDPGEMLSEAVWQAGDEGWALTGQAYCPRHAWRARGRLRTVGEGIDWVNVVNLTR